MLKNLLLVTFIGLSTFSFSGNKIKEKDVPAEVKLKMAANFKEVKDIKWTKDGYNYSAEFIEAETEMAVVLDPTGRVLNKKITIDMLQLPFSSIDFVNKKEPNKKIKEAYQIIEGNNKYYYQAQTKDYVFFFDEKGEFIKKSKLL